MNYTICIEIRILFIYRTRFVWVKGNNRRSIKIIFYSFGNFYFEMFSRYGVFFGYFGNSKIFFFEICLLYEVE